MGLIFSIINQKGGVGKTTSSINIAMSLAEYGYSTLLIDADPQCDLSTSLGIFKADYTLLNFLNKESLTNKNRIDITKNLYLISGYYDVMELKLTKSSFQNPLIKIINQYDFIIIDCQPQRVITSKLTLNECVLNSTDYLLLPLDVNYNSVKGTLDFINSIQRIKTTYNNKLKIMGIFFTKVNERESQFSEYITYLKKQNEDIMLQSYIRRDISVKKSQSVGLTLSQFNKKSKAYHDYKTLAYEILNKLKLDEKTHKQFRITQPVTY